MRKAAALLVALIAVGCADDTQIIRYGVKDFTEQKIVAHIAKNLLEAKLQVKVEIDNCGDTFGCQQALRSGTIDLLVEYTGTGYIYSGAPDTPEQIDLAKVTSLYEPLGIRWAVPLGFENAYRVAVRADRAEQASLEAIEDLAREGARFAIPDTYASRPRDGYVPLLQRHGITGLDPLIDESPEARAKALMDGAVDAAIVYSTDGSLRGLNMIFLEDSLGFFPAYDAVILGTETFLKKNPKVVETLGILNRGIATETMRNLNHRVDIQGQTANQAALLFLRSHNLIDEELASRAQASPELKVAVGLNDALGQERELVLRLVREAIPERIGVISAVSDPLDSLRRGRARLALVGAERLFDDFGKRETTAEAITAVSTRVIHVLRRHDDPGEVFAGKIGLLARGSGSAIAGEALLRGAGIAAHSYGALDAQLAALEANEVDAVLVLAPVGRADVAAALAGGAIRLAPVDDQRTRGLVPHLRPARIPADSYRVQAAAVETLSAQVVLVGPAPQAKRPLVGGPSDVAPSKLRPLTLAEAKAISEASGISEAPDPALLSIWNRPKISEERTDTSARLDTVLNLLVFLFIGWLALQTFRPRRDDEPSTIAD
jgi:glycine betaine/choline ABC-type transport system substrate-binding protein